MQQPLFDDCDPAVIGSTGGHLIVPAPTAVAGSVPTPFDEQATVGSAPASRQPLGKPLMPTDGASTEPPAARMSEPKVEVRRSKRRRRSVSAYRDGDTVVILMPAHIPKRDEQMWITDMVKRLDRQDARRRPSDEALMKRARRIAREYLPKSVEPTSVRWVSNQRRRWGSCTPSDGTIRLSDRMQGMPQYVIDYVLLHELAHLIEFGHGPAFEALVSVYPHDARARGYLDGWIDGSGQRVDDDDGPSVDVPHLT